MIPKFLKSGDIVIFMRNEKKIVDIYINNDSEEILKPYVIKFEFCEEVVVPPNTIFDVIEKVKSKKKRKGYFI